MADENILDIVEVPRQNSAVLDTGGATERPDAGTRSIVTNTNEITDLTQPTRTSPDQSGYGPSKLETMADEALQELCEEQAWAITGGNREQLREVGVALSTMIRDIMAQVLGDEGWLYAIALQIVQQVGATGLKDALKQQILANVNPYELRELMLIMDRADPKHDDEIAAEESDETRPTEAELLTRIEQYVEAAEKYQPSTEMRGQVEMQAITPASLGCAAEYADAMDIARRPGLDVPSNWAFGRQVHIAITAHYLAKMQFGMKVIERAVFSAGGRRWDTLGRLAKEGALPPPLAALEVALMTTALSEKLERYVKTRLKPDIVDFSGPPGEIYEIKSRRSAPDAVLQVCGYLHAYTLVTDPRKHPLRLGTRYRPPRYIPLGEKHFAIPYTREQLPGLILYNVYLKPDSRRRVLRRAAAEAAEFRERALFGLLLLLAAGLLVFIGFGLVALAAGGGGAAAGAGGATVIPITVATAAEASAAASTAKAAGVIFGIMQVQRLNNPNDAALKAVSDAAAQPVY